MTAKLVRLVAFVAAAALAGCGSLPRGAAITSEIVGSADDPEADFAIYPVTRAFLPTLRAWPTTGSRHLPWIGATRGPKSQIIREGDMLDLVIWDSGESSLLTSPGARAVELSAMQVSPSGTIFVPYIGDVLVRGQTPDSARQEIQRSLEAIIPSAQVQLALQAGRSNSVDLVGGVVAPGEYPMPDRDYTVLSLIAAGGGVLTTFENPQIRLVRGSTIYGTSIDRLYANPALDTRLQGGDQVIVEEDERYFLSLGAAGEEALFPFPRDDLSAAQALAIIGGVQDSRANPKGVLVLREYPASAVAPGVRGPRKDRVVFAIDLTTPDGLFSSRQFPIQSGDLVLATESPVTSTQTIFSLVGSAVGLVSSPALN